MVKIILKCGVRNSYKCFINLCLVIQMSHDQFFFKFMLAFGLGVIMQGDIVQGAIIQGDIII